MKNIILISILSLLFLSSCLDEKTLGASPKTVNSVAGKEGDVILQVSDVTGLGTAASLNAGTSAGNLVQLDAGALIPSSLIAPSGSVTLAGDIVGAANATVISKIVTTTLTISSLTTNDILRFNGTAWVNTPQTFNQFAGELVDYVGTTCPSGTVLGDGSVYNRTTDADMFGAMGCSHGCPTGTTFNVIDLRGRFARYVDQATGRDPDAGARTAQAVGGATGDNVGSIQDDDFQLHTHVQNSHNHTQDAHNHTQDPHSHTQRYSTTGGVPVFPSGVTSNTQADAGSTSATTATNQATTATNQAATAVNQGTGGNETRPKNVYILPCIRRYNR